MSGESIEELKKHTKVYLNVLYTLMVLTVLTVAVAYFNLPVVAAIIVALLIATVKGALVAGFFMHLIGEKKLIFQLLLLTGFFFAAMLGLMLMTSTGSVGTNIAPEVVMTSGDEGGDREAEESAGEEH